MEIVYNLEENVNRPILKLDEIFSGCTALVDTGAVFPVWTKDEKLLEQLGGKLVQKNVPFRGFGGLVTGNVYKLNLLLGKITFPNIQIMAHKDNSIPGFFIFSATMLEKTIYTIDNLSKKFIISPINNQVCFHLSILDSNGQVHILCSEV